MRRIRLFCAAMLAGFMLLSVPAIAATKADYTPAGFAAAQKAGKPILVHVNASWCPTCAQQRPILAKLEAEPQYRDLQVFQVDFDSQKDVVKQFGVRMQSTLITFHGGKETGRAVGITDPAEIAAALAKANG